MSTYTFGAASVDVSVGHETISVMTYDRKTGNSTGPRRYSGYTISETVCAALIDSGLAADWVEAIDMIERAGLPYVSDEDE